MFENNCNRVECDSITFDVDRLNTNHENAIITMKSIRTLKDDSENSDVSEIITKGFYRKKGNISQIAYQESDDNGFAGCNTKLTANSNSLVSIFREGRQYNSNLVIQCNNRVMTVYNTPIGNIDMSTTGRQIENHLNDDGGTLYMRYTLDMSGNCFSENEITITVELL